MESSSQGGESGEDGRHQPGYQAAIALTTKSCQADIGRSGILQFKGTDVTQRATHSWAAGSGQETLDYITGGATAVGHTVQSGAGQG
jgi:hypothetical protein